MCSDHELECAQVGNEGQIRWVEPGVRQSSCARDEDDVDSGGSEVKVNSKDCEEVKNEFSADATANEANLRT
jgi:hypothetical protein